MIFIELNVLIEQRKIFMYMAIVQGGVESGSQSLHLYCCKRIDDQLA